MAAVHRGRRRIQTPGWTEAAKASRLGQPHMVGHRALISNLGAVPGGGADRGDAADEAGAHGRRPNAGAA